MYVQYLKYSETVIYGCCRCDTFVYKIPFSARYKLNKRFQDNLVPLLLIHVILYSAGTCP